MFDWLKYINQYKNRTTPNPHYTIVVQHTVGSQYCATELYYSTIFNAVVHSTDLVYCTGTGYQINVKHINEIITFFILGVFPFPQTDLRLITITIIINYRIDFIRENYSSIRIRSIRIYSQSTYLADSCWWGDIQWMKLKL